MACMTMDRLFFEAINSFIGVLSGRKWAPHQQVCSFLAKLLEMARIFKNECSSTEEKLLEEVLSNLLGNESKLTGAAGVDLLLSMMKVIDLLFRRLMEQVQSIRKLQDERDQFLAEIGALNAIVDSMRSLGGTERIDDKVGSEIEKETVDLQAVCLCSNYIAHYMAHHRDFSSVVIVVLWKSEIPGPSICHDGMPLLYVYHRTPAEDFAAWGEFQHIHSMSHIREYSSSELQQSYEVKDIIERHQNRLFASHSNLVAIRSSDPADKKSIEFVVLCKHFVPIADREPLPRDLDGIPTRVCSGWIEMCGRQEQLLQRPMRPGAGFAVGADASLNLEVSSKDYVPPVLATLGGWYVVNDSTFGVTCAHCINTVEKMGSLVYQPSAMGLIVNAASTFPGLLDGYDRVKSTNGNQHAMKWLITQINDNNSTFSAELPSEAKCGTVLGGVLGPLNNGGPVVDVAMVKLMEPPEATCVSSFEFPGITSPPLQLGDGATKILELGEFPRRPFILYGRGARSASTMTATVNPLMSEIWFRNIQPDRVGSLVFICIHAETQRNWNPGDSGTWCWTEDGMLVGMGMAYAHIDNRHYCCMLPMSNVVAAIAQLMEGLS